MDDLDEAKHLSTCQCLQELQAKMCFRVVAGLVEKRPEKTNSTPSK